MYKQKFSKKIMIYQLELTNYNSIQVNILNY